MKQVDRAFQVSMAALIVLSALMLAAAEGNVFPQVLTVPLAVAALILTERRRVLQLSVSVANLLGLLALGLAVLEYFRGNMEARLLSGTHLLVYLSWILLFQKKKARHYWSMFALSLLQVAVGSVLTKQPFYGGLLVLYVGLSVWTLTLFTLFQADLPSDEDRNQRPRDSEWGRRRSRLVRRWLGQRAASRNDDGPAAEAGPGAASLLAASGVIGDNRRQQPQAWLTPGFVATTAGTTLVSILVAAAFFLTVPRLWMGRLRISEGLSQIAATRMTGFSDDVRLNSLGEILESTQRVLFVRVYDAGGNSVDVGEYARRLGYDEPLFRGAVLSIYREGRWRMGRTRYATSTTAPAERAALFRQEIRMHPMRTPFLMAMQPVAGCRLHEPEAGVRHHSFSGMLSSSKARHWNRPLRYTVYSPAEANTGLNAARVLPPSEFQRLINRCRHFPNEGGRLDRLEDLAHRVSGFNRPRDRRPSRLEMARRMEAHLRDSGEYGYTLKMDVQDASIDPVEDFLFNRKSGHCEYYSSALALMLRAVEIPSRLVNGFKGGTINQFTGEFEIEQRHAHSWVEAYIDGKWITLDATPADERSQSVASLGSGINSWDDFKNMLANSWRWLVIDIDLTRQRSQIYNPLRRAAEDWWNALKNPQQGSGGIIRSVGNFLRSPRRWFSWQGGVFTAVVLLLFSGLVWCIRRLAGLLRSFRHRDANHDNARRKLIRFYQRFRELCRAHGITRGPAQTEREFAAFVLRELGPSLRSARLEAFPEELVESYYRVRFGERPLDAEMELSINRRLDQLERMANNERAGSNGQG